MFQQILIIGRLGADPDIRYTPDGTPVANIRIATDESYKNKGGEKVARTEWHRVVAFGKMAETIGNYLGKGRQVMIVGKNHTRKWTDQNGVDRYTTEIFASNMRMLDSAKKESTPADTAPPVEHIPDGILPDDDVPF